MRRKNNNFLTNLFKVSFAGSITLLMLLLSFESSAKKVFVVGPGPAMDLMYNNKVSKLGSNNVFRITSPRDNQEILRNVKKHDIDLPRSLLKPVIKVALGT